MIRRMDNSDLHKVMDIWLKCNISAHSFVDRSYWEDNFEMVTELIPKAEIWIYEEGKNILGFVGIIEKGYIAGIFVMNGFQGRGIGKALLNKCKELYPELSLSVFCKNAQALDFYISQDFTIIAEEVNEDTHEREFIMKWQK